MTKIEPEEIESLDNDLATLPDESDDTFDWKAHSKSVAEKAITRREKSKVFRQQYKEMATELASLKPRPQEVPPLKKEEPKSDDFGLLQKTYLASVAKVIEPDEVELAEKGWQEYKKHGGTFEQYCSSKVFKTELEEHREKKTNAVATAHVRGDATATPPKEDVDVIAGKLLAGELEGLPQDKSILAEAALKVSEKLKSGGKTFYND